MKGYRAVFDELPKSSPRIPQTTIWRIDEQEAIADGGFLADKIEGQATYHIESVETVELYDFNWNVATSHDRWQCDEVYLPRLTPVQRTKELQHAILFLHYHETGQVLNRTDIRIKDLERHES